MTKRIFLWAVVLISAFALQAQNVNLIPRPASLTETGGTLKLPKGYGVTVKGTLPDAMMEEVKKFAKSDVLAPRITPKKGLLEITHSAAVPADGYELTVTPKGMALAASDAAGLFYGLQSVNQLERLGLNKGKSATVPCLQIVDAPRFPYRGFMLDVSRHFFDAQQIKKMLDVMAMYKLNRFHWHLTDDQGWRLPVKGYPELTSKGATASNVLETNFETKQIGRAGKDVAYGPFSYTPEEIKDIVAYAKARHIEVLPEIDMPGHMVAAIHAYPQFSTDPESKLVPDSVDRNGDIPPNQPFSHFTHNIWNGGGVSRDVLDVSNPEVMKFTKAVVDQLAEFFPYEYIHIGGDECPTLAWELSPSCQGLRENLRLRNCRGLQGWFTKEIADYAAEKHGKKIVGWNELITEEGADLKTMGKIKPQIMCWIDIKSAIDKAQKLGLDYIYTPFWDGYYINRSYKGIDDFGAGRDGSLKQTYETNPPTEPGCIGVQGTFWTEWVGRNADLEYLALPRLLAIAEHGWSPAEGKPDYDAFLSRAKKHAPLLKAAGYNYGRHQLGE